MLSDYVTEAAKSRAQWIEQVARTLLATGVTLDRLSLQEHPNCRTSLCVDGAPVSEWKLVLTGWES